MMLIKLSGIFNISNLRGKNQSSRLHVQFWVDHVYYALVLIGSLHENKLPISIYIYIYISCYDGDIFIAYIFVTLSIKVININQM